MNYFNKEINHSDNLNSIKLPVIEITYFDDSDKEVKFESYPVSHFLDKESKALKKTINYN